MSWQDYRNLLETQNQDPTAWQAARLANPNDPETALFFALNSVLTEDAETGLRGIAVLMLGLAAVAHVQKPPWDGKPLIDW